MDREFLLNHGFRNEGKNRLRYQRTYFMPEAQEIGRLLKLNGRVLSVEITYDAVEKMCCVRTEGERRSITGETLRGVLLKYDKSSVNLAASIEKRLQRKQ